MYSEYGTFSMGLFNQSLYVAVAGQGVLFDVSKFSLVSGQGVYNVSTIMYNFTGPIYLAFSWDMERSGSAYAYVGFPPTGDLYVQRSSLSPPMRNWGWSGWSVDDGLLFFRA